jgi:hypothetical protein
MDRLRIKFNCIPALVIFVIPVFFLIPVLFNNLGPGASNLTSASNESFIVVDLIRNGA